MSEDKDYKTIVIPCKRCARALLALAKRSLIAKTEKGYAPKS